MYMTECVPKTATVDGEVICEAKKGNAPPYRPGETEMNITVDAKNLFGNKTFTYPFDHYRNSESDPFTVDIILFTRK